MISACLTALASLLVVATGGAPPPEGFEILGVSVVRESSDEVELAVTYRLSRVVAPAYLGAITLFGGRSTGHWSYRPAELERGVHTAVVTVGLNTDAPSIYPSDSFELQVYGGTSSTYRYPYPKTWCAGGGRCRDDLLREQESAPLAERLTSVQPSIRAAALEEAEALDESSRRILLPEVLERVHHADLAVRFNALEILMDWGLVDPSSTPPLVEAISDPHPGISRVATGVLARIATGDDPLAEDALARAATSSDETTRQSAQAGLERIRNERRMASKPKLRGPVPETKASCLEAGGRWDRFGLYRIPECNLPTPDEGASCADSLDCVSACVAEGEIPGLVDPVAGRGVCYGWTILRGTCLHPVRAGMIQPMLCID